MNDIAEKYAELREELNNKDPLFRYAKLKEELDQKDPMFRYQSVKEEIEKIKAEKEEKTLESLENLFQALGGEEAVVRSESKIARNAEERQENVVEEPIGDVEKIDLREEELTETKKENLTSGLESIVDVISKQEAGREKLQEEIDPVSTRIEKIEKWIQKIAVAGPGSGEVRILNMDDVDTTDLANNKYLKYNSSTGKFVFATVSDGGSGGHTIQNAASDLTARTNLNFDGTYVIATDDSGNDQSDITLSSALQSWHGKSRPSGDVIGTTDSQTLTNKTLASPVINTGVSGTAILDEDNMASDSATQIATQQSIKAYVDAQILTEDTIAELNDTTISSASDGHFLVHTGSAWVNEAPATALASLGVTSSAAELNLLDGSSAGSVVNSKGVIYSGTGTIAGTLSTAAQGNVTSLGTLTTLTVDDIIINGTNIGHTSDSDAIAIASNGNVTISQDLLVSGDFTISGTTTTVNSTVTTVVDPIMTLQTATGGGALSSDTNKDVGLALQYHTGSAAKTAFLGYDDSAGKLTFVPDATISSEVVSGTKGTIVANLEGAVTGDVTGNADTATTLANARTLGGVSFDGSANINLPGVNASGNQDTSGNAATATALATGRTIGMTGDVVWTSASFTGSGNVTGAATIQAGAVENSMLADDAVGADELASDAVVNASVASGAAIALTKLATTTASRVLETSGTGVISASDVTTTELALLDGTSAGTVVNSKAVIYSGTGTIAGTLSTAAQGNVTSLGTLTTLTVDNVIINGTTIGHTGDTDLMTVASGILTVAGEVSMTTLDIGGTNVTSTAAELNRLDGIGSAAVGLTDSQTMTNKTLTSPVINTGVSGTAVLDEDDMASDSATKIATQQSIKAYTDATSTAMSIALG